MSGDWLRSCWLIWVRTIAMSKGSSAHKKSAKLNWMSTKGTNKWGTVQLGRGLFYCTTKWMTWHPHLIPRWSDTYWKFNLCCLLGYEMTGFQYGLKPGFWLYFMLFTINIRFYLYLNERAILTSWQYGCTSSVEPEISETTWELWFAVLGSTLGNSN